MNIPIYFKRSSVAGKSPETTGTSGIGYGEPAINYNKDNEALFFKNASNEIKTVPLDASVPYDKISGLTNINEGLSSKKDAFGYVRIYDILKNINDKLGAPSPSEPVYVFTSEGNTFEINTGGTVQIPITSTKTVDGVTTYVDYTFSSAVNGVTITNKNSTGLTVQHDGLSVGSSTAFGLTQTDSNKGLSITINCVDSTSGEPTTTSSEQAPEEGGTEDNSSDGPNGSNTSTQELMNNNDGALEKE